MRLREYQKEAHDCILEEFKTVQSTLMVMATGCGKTICFSHVAKEFRKTGRIMMLAHREELIFQGRDKMSKICGVEADIEMGNNWAAENWIKTDIVVSTVQTQVASRGGRMERFDPNEFSLLITDECVPAGTLIDGVPIEKRKVGEYIRAYNHSTNKIEKKKITHVFKRENPILVKIRLFNGKTLVCTPNHPVFTLRGYVPAGTLTDSDVMLTTIEERNDYGDGTQVYLRELQERVFFKIQKDKNLLQRVSKQNSFISNGKNQQEICVCENEEEQSYEESSDESESVDDAARYGVEAICSGWKRETSYCPATVVGLCAGMGNRSGNSDKATTWKWLSKLLQGRRWKQSSKDCGRSGRLQPSGSCQETTRQEEDKFFTLVRVDSVTFYERGSYPEYGSLCPDGFVYNLEVEDHNNYFAEDLLVHNCHHAVSPSWKKVIDYYKQNPNLKVLGCTATPDRADEKAMGLIFQSVAFDYDILSAITDGWLVPIQQRSVFVKGLDFSQCRTTAGDLNGKDLSAVMEFEENLHEVAGPTVELTGDRKTLIFAVSVAQAERLAEILNRHKPDSAKFVCGMTPKDERRTVLEEYKAGDFQYLVNVGCFTEGFDEPGVEVVVMARPTKSRSLFSQMAGRGTRPLDEISHELNDAGSSTLRCKMIADSDKPFVEIIDFVGNCGKHKLMTSADILGGNYDDDVVELAKKNAEEKSEKTGKPVDVASELKQAEKQLVESRRRAKEAAIREKIKANARYSTAVVNPFDKFDIIPCREKEWNKGKMPTLNQLAYLENNGVNVPENLTFTHASQLIGVVKDRRAILPCSAKQAKLLQKYHYKTDVTKAEASKIIGKIAANGWRRPTG